MALVAALDHLLPRLQPVRRQPHREDQVAAGDDILQPGAAGSTSTPVAPALTPGDGPAVALCLDLPRYEADHRGVHCERRPGHEGREALTWMRVRPRADLNSLAWILWHIARAEDVMVNLVVAGCDQVFDDAWMRRLKVTRRDLGFAMTTEEVTELTGAIDIDALREYRDAVGRRTREFVCRFGDKDWTGDVAAAELERAASQDAFARGQMSS